MNQKINKKIQNICHSLKNLNKERKQTDDRCHGCYCHKLNHSKNLSLILIQGKILEEVIYVAQSEAHILLVWLKKKALVRLYVHILKITVFLNERSSAMSNSLALPHLFS